MPARQREGKNHGRRSDHLQTGTDSKGSDQVNITETKAATASKPQGLSPFVAKQLEQHIASVKAEKHSKGSQPQSVTPPPPIQKTEELHRCCQSCGRTVAAFYANTGQGVGVCSKGCNEEYEKNRYNHLLTATSVTA